MSHPAPNKSANRAVEPYTAPRILGMNLTPGQTIYCPQSVQVQWEKDGNMGAQYQGTVTLDCSGGGGAHATHQLSAIAPDMLPFGTSYFTLNHTANHDNVTVKATITMPSGASHSMERVVNVRCGMMPAAAAAERKAKEGNDREDDPITLDPSVYNPILLIPGQAAGLIGLVQAWIDAVTVTVLEVWDEEDRVIAELAARLRPGPTNQLKTWSVLIPAGLVPRECGGRRLLLRLELREDNQVVFTKVLFTFLICPPSK